MNQPFLSPSPHSLVTRVREQRKEEGLSSLGSLAVWGVALASGQADTCEQNLPAGSTVTLPPFKDELVLRSGPYVLREPVHHVIYVFCFAVWVVNDVNTNKITKKLLCKDTALGRGTQGSGSDAGRVVSRTLGGGFARGRPGLPRNSPTRAALPNTHVPRQAYASRVKHQTSICAVYGYI